MRFGDVGKDGDAGFSAVPLIVGMAVNLPVSADVEGCLTMEAGFVFETTMGFGGGGAAARRRSPARRSWSV